MCVVSNIGDYWKDRLPDQYPWINPHITPLTPTGPQTGGSHTFTIGPGVTQQQFDELKKEMEELKQLLKAAIKFDEKTNQPHCEQEEKIQLIRKVAELVGVDMKDVFPDGKSV